MIRHFLGGFASPECSGLASHLQQALARKGREHLGEPPRCEITLRHQQCRFPVREKVRIERLMIINGVRQRHENAGNAGGGQFGHRNGAGTTHDDVSLRISRCHVINERDYIGLDPGLLVCSLQYLEVLLS